MRYTNFLRFGRAALAAFFLFLLVVAPAWAASPIAAPPLGERWFGIKVNDEYMGFSRLRISRLPDGGYRIDGDGSVRMQIMGFTREATFREQYLVTPALTLRSFEVEQSLSGKHAQLSGKMIGGGVQVRREADGKVTERFLKSRGEVFPASVLNLLPLMRGGSSGRQYRVQFFDPEDVRIKEVKISLIGEERTPDGQPAIRMRNDLYPFVSNDIWVDRQGNTLLESVRDGLVVTKAESPEILAPLISGLALSQKDLIYDFSMVRATPSLSRPVAELKGLAVRIEGYGETLPLLNDSFQNVERQNGNLTIRTGSLRQERAATQALPPAHYLQPAERIESAAPQIMSRAAEVAGAVSTASEKAARLADWTARWLEDSIDDSGSALAALEKKSGNCQSHARLYTALARAAGIPTRFVSGLVTQDGKGFLYHSWAESWIDGRWLAVDPTFNQTPADPSHLALFEGDRPADLAPLVSLIGRIRLQILEQAP
ncbi:transglutaminase-like domain-containing protein [Trichlorobacter ammonificans]|uniref:Transglutaminase domain protein n=1 Tax=Trichlorobacter ammonificans TaxID=2916410 RepID=A0ABM9DCC2_9BACT|nr:transglutaminase-like domain-containing protein [Trichlorobacter ammonificans]CAH2032505.1 Transglutaminase domain protein [Trichlorobacter ammonificans]